MAKQKWDNPETNDLIKTICALKNKEEARDFLRDLLTEGELIEFGKRWKAVQMIAEKERYMEIQAKTGLSSTTVARVARWFKKGTGGYRRMLLRMKKTIIK